MEKSENIVKISVALLKAQKKMENAVKTSSNPFFKSKFADLNSVREASMPVLNEEGISVLQPIVQKDGKSFVRTLLLHDSGEYLSSDVEIVAAKQNDPQAQGSAISYARRYGLQSFLSLGADDDDGEKAMGRKSVELPKTAPVAKLEPAVAQVPSPEQTSIVVPPEAPKNVSSESPRKVSTFRKPKETVKVEEDNGWE